MADETAVAPESLEVLPGALVALRKTRPWVLFLGVMAIIGAVFIGFDVLIQALVLAVGVGAMHGGHGAMPLPIGVVAFFLLYMIVLGGILVLGAVWLLQYAAAIRNAMTPSAQAQASLDRALAVQRRLWVLMGVFAIAAVVVGIVTAIVFGTIGFQMPAWPAHG